MRWKVKEQIQAILWHLVFWIALIIFFALFDGSSDHQYPNPFLHAFYTELSLLPVRLLAVYFTWFYLLPKKLGRSRPLQLMGWILASILAWALVLRASVYYITSPILYPELPRTGYWVPYRLIESVIIILIPLILMVLIKIISDWYRKQQKIKVLEKVNLETELELLKSQINPHFFFNTLNNLYGMALEKSEATPTMILKLSEMMSYLLYEANVEKISLKKELSVLDSYVALEQLRYGDQLNCSFQVNGSTDSFHLAPLLLLPLVENAFKHGVNDVIEKCWVNIFINVSENRMEMIVENSRQTVVVRADNNGIGLNNLRRRLDLLYPQAHQFKTYEEPESFWTKLELYDQD